MPLTTSTIIVMGSPGSAKSEFIEFLAKPVSTQTTDSDTANRKTITVSPFIEDDLIVKLVEFPCFSERGVDPTDAELLLDIVKFLEIRPKRHRAINGIIYLHRIADDDVQSPDVDHNLAMLSHIVGESAMKNVVVATDRWERTANATQTKLQTLFSFPSQFKRYDGTKLSALYIIHSVIKQPPELLRIQNELGADEDIGSTTAGQELIERINNFITDTQAEDTRIRKEITAARKVKDAAKVKVLQDELAALGSGPVLDRLKTDQNKLEVPINWEQAEIDSTALDRAVQQRYILVTTDWKAEYNQLAERHESVTNDWNAKYDQLLVRYNQLAERHESLTNALKAKYDKLLAENNRLKDRKFNLSLRVNVDSTTDAAMISRYPTWLLPFKKGEILSAENEVKKAIWVDEFSVFRARNSAGQVGWIATKHVTVIAITS